MLPVPHFCSRRSVVKGSHGAPVTQTSIELIGSSAWNLSHTTQCPAPATCAAMSVTMCGTAVPQLLCMNRCGVLSHSDACNVSIQRPRHLGPSNSIAVPAHPLAWRRPRRGMLHKMNAARDARIAPVNGLDQWDTPSNFMDLKESKEPMVNWGGAFGIDVRALERFLGFKGDASESRSAEVRAFFTERTSFPSPSVSESSSSRVLQREVRCGPAACGSGLARAFPPMPCKPASTPDAHAASGTAGRKVRPDGPSKRFRRSVPRSIP